MSPSEPRSSGFEPMSEKAASLNSVGEDAEVSLASAAVQRALSGRYRTAERELDRVLDAAYALIRRRGTVELTMRELLAEAGMTTEAFYKLFASKDAFVDVLVEDGGLRLASYLTHQVAKATTTAEARDQDTARAGIEAWIRGMLAQAANPEAAARGARLSCTRVGSCKATVWPTSAWRMH